VARAATDLPTVQKYPFRHPEHIQRCSAPVGSDRRLGPTQCVTRTAAQPRPQPVAKIVDGEVSLALPRTVDCEDGYSALMPAALMIGHHFSISALCRAPSASGVCCSRDGISWTISANR